MSINTTELTFIAHDVAKCLDLTANEIIALLDKHGKACFIVTLDEDVVKIEKFMSNVVTIAVNTFSFTNSGDRSTTDAFAVLDYSLKQGRDTILAARIALALHVLSTSD